MDYKNTEPNSLILYTYIYGFNTSEILSTQQITYMPSKRLIQNILLKYFRTFINDYYDKYSLMQYHIVCAATENLD